MGTVNILLASLMVVVAIYQVSGASFSSEAFVGWRKLNRGTPVCFGAAENTQKLFASNYEGCFTKFKLIRRSGFLECEYGYGGYFGCEMYPSHSSHNDHHYHDHDGHYYDHAHDEAKADDEAQKDSPDSHPGLQADYYTGPGPHYLHQVSTFISSYGALLYPQQPFVGAYYTIPGTNRPAWDNEIELPINGCPICLHRAQELTLHFGEDYMNIDTADNNGEICVDVLAYGEELFETSS